jgi:transmembrane sensor
MFEVAKDKQKPFTVYAGAFATTAIGTEFIVKQQSNNIKVQLLHGKVVIKATDVAIKNWKDVYLLPGQQMIFNEKDKLPRVDLIPDKKNNTATHPVQNNTLSETADSLIFNGNSISSVLQKLSNYYHVDILFNEPELRDISFTGVIAKKDSVQNILKVITQMNGLSLEKSDSNFIISKIQANDTHL